MVPLPDDVVVLAAGVVVELDAGGVVDVPGEVELVLLVVVEPLELPVVVVVALAPDVMGIVGPSTETQT